MTSEKQQKEQLRIPTNLCLKFQAKTPNGYGETSFTRFSVVVPFAVFTDVMHILSIFRVKNFVFFTQIV